MEGTIRLYDHLFTKEDPMDLEDGDDFTSFLNPDSLEELTSCKLERSLEKAERVIGYQFERQGYFCVDEKDHTPDNPVFNRTVTLRDTWAKMQKRAKKQPHGKK